MFDKILVHEEGIERFLPCPTCMVKGKDRYFFDVGPGFEPHDKMELCQSPRFIDEDFGDTFIVKEKHSLDSKQKCLIGSKEQVSTLHQFLKDGIQTIQKVAFRELECDLEVGHQIWIYRDRRTSPCNPVAVMMPYAHVAVYVGEEHGEKKVVHVEKASCLSGIMTATIKKVPLAHVINPNDQGNARPTTKVQFIYFLIPVFLGHEIPAVRHAINTRDQIVAKANALAEPPQLLFDYDHHNNCEAFANLLIGAADLESGEGVKGVMGHHTHPCIAAFCCILDCFRCCRERKHLCDVVQGRLKKRGLSK